MKQFNSYAYYFIRIFFTLLFSGKVRHTFGSFAFYYFRRNKPFFRGKSCGFWSFVLPHFFPGNISSGFFHATWYNLHPVYINGAVLMPSLYAFYPLSIYSHSAYYWGRRYRVSCRGYFVFLIFGLFSQLCGISPTTYSPQRSAYSKTSGYAHTCSFAHSSIRITLRVYLRCKLTFYSRPCTLLNTLAITLTKSSTNSTT